MKTFPIPLTQRKKQRNSDGNMTARQQAEKEGKSVSCMAKRWKDSFPGIPFAADSELTADQLSAISKERKSGSVKNTETEMSGKSIMKRTLTPAGDKGCPPGKSKQPFLLYGLMAAPAIASIQNMYSVTGDLTGFYSGIMLTAVFSLSPFAFILIGLRGFFVKSLTLLMIAYECFCNVMRIYGGLTRFGSDGYPTRFLGLVTDFCNSGTYATARTLSVFMALIAAGVFYAAYLQLNKSK